MKILFTGASSFTGFWFVGRLAAGGAEVTAALRGRAQDYKGVRAERAKWLGQWAEVVPACAFGSPVFLDLIRSRDYDVICHHGAEVADYRSPEFDVAGAVAANTFNLRETLKAFVERGGKALVATGSVFEAEEGAGEPPLRAFSPYGLSKGLTWAALQQGCEAVGLAAHKFVVANPFGPYEEPRFVAHAVERWAKGEAVEVRTPLYLRDNVHVDLLSMAYAQFVREAAAGGPGRRLGPCGYRETQGAFAERLARELGPRLGLAARVTQARQTDFSEPMARVNRDAVDPASVGWDEAKAWDALAGFYRQRGLGSAAPEVYGAVDEFSHGFVAGWLTAREPGKPRYARILVDGVERASVRADIWRQDLFDRRISDGRSGFRFTFSGGLNPYAEQRVRIEDRDTGRLVGGDALTLPRLVGGPDAPFAGEADFAVVNLSSAAYQDGRVRVHLEAFGAAAEAPLVSPEAAVEVVEAAPLRHAYLDAVGLAASLRIVDLRPRDPDVLVTLRAEGLDDLLCANLVSSRLPDYVGLLDPENMERVSGKGEKAGRFAAGGLATAFRIDGLARRHFGRGIAQCGRCLDWGAGAGRVALPMKRVIAPEVELVACDVDGFNVAAGRALFPDIAFVDAPFLPPLPFPDGHFGAVYGVSVLTHLTESAQFAWLRELRRVLAPGAPAIVTVHSDYQLLRLAAARPDLLAETVARGISDSMFDLNLGPKLDEKSYYRATFHTRRYLLENWSPVFEIVKIYTSANGGTQDFVVMRAR